MAHLNIEIIERVVHKLGPLMDNMVLVGGCAADLLVNSPIAADARETKDVDTIVHMSHRHDYQDLGEQLHAVGFQEDSSEGAPRCRWVSGDLILDVVPTPDIAGMGFANPWYTEAIEHALSFTLPSGEKIRIISPAYFIMTKILAMEDRSKNDYLSSHDLEDIISVIDGRLDILQEIQKADVNIQEALATHFTHLLKSNDFVQSISAHLLSDATHQARTPFVKSIMLDLAHLNNHQ